VTNQHLRDLSLGPLTEVKQWHTLYVNGYKFHTDAWSQGKKIINSGVYVKGLTNEGEDDFYGIIKHIYKIKYNTSSTPKKVIVFYCDWFDPSRRGTRVDFKYHVVDIRMDKRYVPYDPFIIDHNVRQVYYVSYPPSRIDKRGWCAVIKTKPRGRIEATDVDDDMPYQEDQVSHVNEVIEVEPILGFQDSENGVEVEDEAIEEDTEEEEIQDFDLEEEDDEGEFDDHESEEDNEEMELNDDSSE